jgi:DNA-binding NarL/FixJ family response regulator
LQVKKYWESDLQRDCSVALARVLIVDDAVLWQNLLVERLEQEPSLRVVGIASDGLTAVQMATELQPDLILLDLNLPVMNGLEVARQIRILSPGSKMLFVSGEADPEIQQVALSSGGSGYLLKNDASELMIAIEAVLSGKTFVNPETAGRDD